MSQGTPNVTSQQFDELFRALSNWGRWGREDQRGAVNHLTPERLIAAAGLVRDGATVTLSLPLNTQAAMHNPKPADHYMTEISPPDAAPQSVHFLKDYVGADYHNDGHSHIDALCHVAYEGLTYNGRSAGAVTDDGAEDNTIEVLASGLIGRGVLLDIPRLHGLPWLEPGEHVLKDDLEAAERAQRVTDFPIHVLALAAMGIRLLDYLQFEDLRAACEETARWEFLFVASPLRIEGGTGSPINPTAVF